MLILSYDAVYDRVYLKGRFMHIDPQTGALYLSQYAKAILPHSDPQTLKNTVARLGATGIDQYVTEVYVGSKTLRVSFGFQEGKLRWATVELTGKIAEGEFTALQQAYADLLQEMTIEARDYEWGNLRVESMPQAGEMWIAVRYS
jgi:hypothetical protein